MRSCSSRRLMRASRRSGRSGASCAALASSFSASPALSSVDRGVRLHDERLRNATQAFLRARVAGSCLMTRAKSSSALSSPPVRRPARTASSARCSCHRRSLRARLARVARAGREVRQARIRGQNAEAIASMRAVAVASIVRRERTLRLPASTSADFLSPACATCVRRIGREQTLVHRRGAVVAEHLAGIERLSLPDRAARRSGHRCRFPPLRWISRAFRLRAAAEEFARCVERWCAAARSFRFSASSARSRSLRPTCSSPARAMSLSGSCARAAWNSSRALSGCQ